MNKCTTVFKTLIVSTSLMTTVCAWGSQPLIKKLHEGWRFKQVRLTNWYPATVPGVVHTDLLQNGIIEDPFYRLNERGVQWIDKEDWLYENRFTADIELLKQENQELVFEGLDTYADVFINDSCVLKANNMFRRWVVDVKPYLRRGENVLKVYFHSPVKVDVPKWDAIPYHYPAVNDQSENGGLLNKKISVFARKAGYHYGWDWGPRLVTSGIWRPVYLLAWSDLRIENVFIEQKKVDARRAVIAGRVEILADKALRDARISITDEATGKVLGQKVVILQPGLNQVTIDFVLNKPQLWWSNGLGKPHLYNFRTMVENAGVALDTQTERVGIRSLKVVRKPDEYGHTFYVELNGKPVFAKGANYIPSDNFLPRVTAENYKQTILDAVTVNMNMLRVWGGGIYENNIFYDLCDEYGILVWQDFMFACSMYPAEGELLENIRLEAIYNVKRLRNHACIALWCGNNECQDAWLGWGWKRNVEKEGKAYADKIWNQYVQQYHVTLPEVVSQYAPETFYWPSSPFAFEDEVSGATDGDRHYWEVWHGKRPISDYNTTKSRFFSEYGLQSFPEFASVKRYAPLQEDWNIRSEVMMLHQRGGEHANGLIETYLLNEYKTPRDFSSFLYMNHVLQGDGIKTAMESHRRQMPYNMGTLVWQHNDCWPVASWASRDYYGRWKAQHYFTRKAFDDLLISPVMEEGEVRIYGVSDRLEKTSGQLKAVLTTFAGEELRQWNKLINLQPVDSKVVLSIPLAECSTDTVSVDRYLHLTYIDKAGRTYTNNLFFGKQKAMSYPKVKLNAFITPMDGGFQVVVSADKFARAVFLSIDDNTSVYSDNYFDVEPGKQVTIAVKTTIDEQVFRNSLKMECLNNHFQTSQ